MNISNTVNVYLAFRSVLLSLLNTDIKYVVIPGLGTGIGKISPLICAKQMYLAYNSIINTNMRLDLIEKTQEYLYMLCDNK